MTSTFASVPWLINVARRAKLPCAEQMRPDGRARLDDSWRALGDACSLDDDAITRIVADAFKLKPAQLGGIERKALKLVPEKLVRAHNILPLAENDRTIYIATSDPTDVDIEHAIGFASGRRTEFQVASPSALRDAINEHYSADHMVETLLKSVDNADADSVRMIEELGPEVVAAQELNAAPIIKLTNLILREGVRQGASDIHIEPGSGMGSVRLRVDGVLRPAMQLPMAALSRVISRLKILAKLDIANRLRPQDGRARIQVEAHTYDLRISTVPTRDAEKAVIRILDPQGSLRLNDIAMPGPERVRFQHLLMHRDGIVVVTGPTGSGKTTTMYAAIHELATGEVNIMTVEDPVEYELAGITQIQVDARRKVTFASALRAILRQDPDVIFVGEIRDLETAEVAVQASNTGHLVLATLHTNDAVGAIARLIDLGLDRASISSALRGIIAQRLLRRVCPSCAVPISGPLTPDEKRLSDAMGVKPVMRAVGCNRCGQSGYKGRLPITEVIVMNPALQDLVATGAGALELERAAIAGGMRKLREIALERVAAGETTLQEVERALGEVAGSGEQPAPVAAPTQPHVLVVDDDADNRLLARTMLEINGFRVSEAPDGKVALETIASSPDLVLVVLDLDMPRVGGRDVLRQLRASVTTASLPVIVLTGSDSEDSEVQVMDEGADDYLRKPMDPARFVARVKATLRRAGS